ncbi:hypothetical protein BJ741DRAFT_627209 [Chytriomyces cf. hyalinus JEL632]|nr:hypothetical protein BJ741DRAFT_627209 [Chytriomyces cf. hyalinus JEL632]
MSTSHRRPVKQNLLSSSPSASLRDTLKNRCMDRMRAARRDRHTATRISTPDRPTAMMPALTTPSEMDCDNSYNDEDSPFNVTTSSRAIRRMMQSEWGALVASVPLDPDLAEQIEREMLQELSDMDHLHRVQGNHPGLNMRPTEYDQSMADEYEAYERDMVEHDVETHLPETVSSCPCPSCHQGLLLVLQEKPCHLFGCSLCLLRVQSRVPLDQWMQSLQGHAANHGTTCSGQVVFVNQEEVGHFLACTGCDYFTGI